MCHSLLVSKTPAGIYAHLIMDMVSGEKMTTKVVITK